MIRDGAIERLREVVDWPDLAGTRYEAREVLGRGGMGTVYRALDHSLEREVALKVLRTSESGADEAGRLLREARVLARLEHPGLVPVHDAGVLPDGRPFYVMRLVRGTCLDAHVAALAPALPARLQLFQRVCEAVAFAHAHGVVHRDLKPQNVMVGPFGEVLVMDWGVARLLGDGAEAAAPVRGAGAGTRAGTVMGTPGYMAPEQAGGSSASADERADVYALGALLFFLLAGRPPDGPGMPEAPLGGPGQSAPRPLAAIVRRALAPRPAERYPNVTGLAADVEAFLAAGRVTAHREGPFEKAGRLLGRYRTAVLLVIAYLLMRVLLLVYAR